MAPRLHVGIALGALSILSACSSAQKARQVEREKLVTNTGMYCDFVNGEEYQDIDVQLNLQIARHCDPNKNFSISSYKNSSDVHGMLYCCSVPRKEDSKKLREEQRHDLSEVKAEEMKHQPVLAPTPTTTMPPSAAAKAAAPAPTGTQAPARSATPASTNTSAPAAAKSATTSGSSTQSPAAQPSAPQTTSPAAKPSATTPVKPNESILDE